MSNNPIPPELVEKYLNNGMTVTIPFSERCAQIAVDYADEWRNDQYQVQKAVIAELQKQRGELLQASNDILEGFKQLLIETGNPNKATDFTFVRRYLQLLKKQEDGN